MRGGTRLDLGGWTLRPEASLAWAHDFADVTATSGHRLAGAAFTAAASRPGRDAALFGVGASVELDEGVSAGLIVQDELRARANTVSARAGLRWKL